MPENVTSSPPRAVFLSYAREDVEPARRIAEALRAFGLEVWFDQRLVHDLKNNEPMI